MNLRLILFLIIIIFVIIFYYKNKNKNKLSSDDISSLTDQWIKEVTVNNDPDAVKFSVTNHHNPYRDCDDFD